MEDTKQPSCVEGLPARVRPAALRATPRGRLPPSSAEPRGRPAAASLPVCGTGTAPAPSAGCSPPLQGAERQMILIMSECEDGRTLYLSSCPPW